MMPEKSNPEPRGRRRIVVWGLALGVPLVAVLIVVIALLTSAGPIDQSSPESVARGYLDAIIEHQPAKAYKVLCADQRAALSEEEWGDRTLKVDRYDYVDARRPDADRDTLAEVEVGVNKPEGKSVVSKLVVVKEDGRWWVCEW
ncbi:hypothetical protein [Dactylosporangium sp. NPDC051541]|uniref:Rv0361 family membrane protein n=1 Tax=Dactylosporangium sp. NPDC051541 TaxID=3363977 RepID=UPI0037A5456B